MWFWYALAGALASSISVVFNKRVLNTKVRASTLSWFLFAFSTPVAWIITLKIGIPKVNNIFFLAILFSSIVFSIGKTLQLHIFKHNPLSDVYTLQAIGPITLYLLGLIFLGEQVKRLAIFGILIMAIGIYILKFKRGTKNLLHPFISLLTNRATLLYLVVILMANLTALSEKVAIHNMPSNATPVYITAWEGVFMSIFTFSIMINRNKNWINEIKSNIKDLSIAGFIYFFVSILIIFGFQAGPIALVASIKKVEVLFVLFLSYFFFKERPSRFVYLGTVFMLIAVFLIKL